MVALIVCIIVILVAAPQAQQPATFTGAPGAMGAGPTATITAATNVDLLVGRSTILNVGAPIARVSLTVPDIADAMVTAPQQLLIHGKTPGTISLFVWDRAGGISTYEINVRRDLKQLVEQMQQLFPGEPIAVVGSGRDVVVSGTVSSKYVIDKAADVAAGYVEKKENVVNLLKQQEGVASNQVMLRVRFAEVSRNAMQELGASLILNGKNDWFGRTTTQQFAAPDFDSSKAGGLTFSDFLNIFLFNSKHDIGAVVKALQSKGLFQSLAEPNLIATNGKEASFLAGGEYPYPVAQGGAGNTAVTIVFKEFGVRLTFTPTVLGGDLINLKVKPEVSALDFANGITMAGFRVPALSTRRTETEVELQDGQTFAIAGLLNNTVTSTMSKIPGIGEIPVLGYLFRSRAFQKQETELVVMITPQIVRRGSMGVSQGLPAAVEPYLGANPKPLPQPAPYIGSPRYPAGGQTPQAPRRDDKPAPASAPAPLASVPVAASVPTMPPAPQAAPIPKPMQPAPKAPAVPGAVAQAVSKTPAVPTRAAQPAPAPKPTKAELKAAGQQREKDKQAVEAEAKAKKASDAKAADDKARQQKLDAGRAKREAIVAKKTAEQEKKQQEEQKKHDKAIADATAKLKQAQNVYQAEVDKNKAGSPGKTKGQR